MRRPFCSLCLRNRISFCELCQTWTSIGEHVLEKNADDIPLCARASLPGSTQVLSQQRRRRRDPASDPDAPQLLSDSPPPQESFASSLRRILVSGFDPQRFAAFCAALIGGATILEVRTTCPFPPWLLEFSSFFLFQWLRLSRRPSRTTPGIPHGNTAELTCATSAYFTDHYRGSSANYQRQQS